MHEVNYNGRTSYVSNYFCCGFRSEGLLYDAKRYLLAIAKFLVSSQKAGFHMCWVCVLIVCLHGIQRSTV